MLLDRDIWKIGANKIAEKFIDVRLANHFIKVNLNEY
jgi:hypothetical protein